MGWASPGSSSALVLVPAVAAGPMEGDWPHTRPHKAAGCPRKWCGSHSGPAVSVPAGVGQGCGHCPHPGRGPAQGRSQSASRGVGRLWGRTAEWPPAPHTPRNCKRRGSLRALCKPASVVGGGVAPEGRGPSRSDKLPRHGPGQAFVTLNPMKPLSSLGRGTPEPPRPGFWP